MTKLRTRLAFVVLGVSLGCASAPNLSPSRRAQEQAILALIQRASREAPATSAVLAVCVNGQRTSRSVLERLQSQSSTPLVSCNRAFDSRDGKYFDRATEKRLWAVDLTDVQLNGPSGSAEGSVHCGLTCGGSHLITLAQANGVWSVVETLEVSVF